MSGGSVSLLPPVDDFVVRGAIIEAVEHRAGLLRHVADAIILAHERPDRPEAVEPHQRLELDLAAKVAFHEVDVEEAGDVPGFDAGNDFGPDDPLILASIL